MYPITLKTNPRKCFYVSSVGTLNSEIDLYMVKECPNSEDAEEAVQLLNSVAYFGWSTWQAVSYAYDADILGGGWLVKVTHEPRE